MIQGFHFEEYTDTLLRELSTGNRKKAFLITAFALKPRLLLLDEPVNGLDFQSTEYLYQQISGYKEHGTVLFSSHILESITLTSDRVFVLEDGKIRQIRGNDYLHASCGSYGCRSLLPEKILVCGRALDCCHSILKYAHLHSAVL